MSWNIYRQIRMADSAIMNYRQYGLITTKRKIRERLETILLSLSIVISVVVIAEQQAKAQVTNDTSKDLQQKPDRMTLALDKFEKCNST
jgi:hypothetical protein